MFCKEYLIDLNATQAAIRAGYSEKTAQEIGSENLSKPIIQLRIEKMKEERSNKLQITSESILQELYNWAYGDFTEIMEISISDIKELPIEIRRLITGFERTIVGGDNPVEKLKVRFVSKEKAIELITKHLPDFYAAEKKEIILDSKKTVSDLFPTEKELNEGDEGQ